MADDIENIIFSRFVNQAIPFELITLKELHRRCAESNYDLSTPHRIEFHALLIITKGNSHHVVDFVKQTLSPGTIIPLVKGQVHNFHPELLIEGFVISFEDEFITSDISEKDLFHFLHLYHAPNLFIGGENVNALLSFIDLLKTVHEDPNPNLKADFIRSMLLSLLIQIKRLTVYQHEVFESQRYKDFIQFKLLINQHYRESHNAKDYAEKLGVSYKYLNDVCKEICHVTAKAFIDSWLLLEIKRNIAEQRYSSKEIAFKMGFDEPSNFLRFFKKYTGTTPQQFAQHMSFG